MAVSIQTFVVVSANLLVAVISVALLLLVIWQSPRERGNRIFAVMMLNLLVFSIANFVHRFVDVLHIDPDSLLDANTTLYIWFVVLLVLFIEAFTHLKIRWVKLCGIMLAATTTILLLAGLLHSSARPSLTDIGGYVVDYTPLGVILVIANIGYVLAVLIMLGRSRDARPRALLPAMICLFAGTVLTLLRPLSSYLEGSNILWAILFTLPYNSVGLAVASIIIGHTVLKYQLFDPIHQLNIQLEQANQNLETASRLKSRFLANMSHELRTPLNSILGYTQLAIEGIYGPVNETQIERLSRVVSNGKNLLALINDLLDISKIEAGRVVIAPERVNTVELIRDIVRLLEPLVEAKKLALNCDYAQAPMIWADEGRVRQILVNIASNAVKFTHKGSISIRACGEEKAVRISIQDTGIGIPKESLMTIFEEFRQLDGSLTRRYEGTGLGLAIAKHLAEMQGGRIEVESAVGIGSTFHVLLPLAEGENGKDKDRAESQVPIATTNTTA